MDKFGRLKRDVYNHLGDEAGAICNASAFIITNLCEINKRRE